MKMKCYKCSSDLKGKETITCSIWRDKEIKVINFCRECYEDLGRIINPREQEVEIAHCVMCDKNEYNTENLNLISIDDSDNKYCLDCFDKIFVSNPRTR